MWICLSDTPVRPADARRNPPELLAVDDEFVVFLPRLGPRQERHQRQRVFGKLFGKERRRRHRVPHGRMPAIVCFELADLLHAA